MTRPFRSAPAEKAVAPASHPFLESFDYTRLEADVAQRAQTAAQRIRRMVERKLEALIAVGEELRAVNQVLRGSRFARWLRAELSWTERTARNFMAVAERFGPKKEVIARLPIDSTAAYLLSRASVPDEAIQVALQRAERGERITRAIARDICHTMHNGQQDTAMAWSLPVLRVRLVETLEFFRREWDRDRVWELARQLREFADSLGGSVRPHRAIRE